MQDLEQETRLSPKHAAVPELLATNTLFPHRVAV